MNLWTPSPSGDNPEDIAGVVFLDRGSFRATDCIKPLFKLAVLTVLHVKKDT